MNITRRGLLGACAVGMATFSSGCTDVTPFVGKRDESDRTFDITVSRTTVKTDSGDAIVSRTDADRVRLHGIKETVSMFIDLEDMTVKTVQNGDHFRISADSETGSFLDLDGGRISVDVGVPEGVAVERVAMKNGDIIATDVVGDARLETTNDEVMARNIDGTPRWAQRTMLSVLGISRGSMKPT